MSSFRKNKVAESHKGWRGQQIPIQIVLGRGQSRSVFSFHVIDAHSPNPNPFGSTVGLREQGGKGIRTLVVVPPVLFFEEVLVYNLSCASEMHLMVMMMRMMTTIRDASDDPDDDHYPERCR